MEDKNWLTFERKISHNGPLPGINIRTDDMTPVRSFSELFSEKYEEFVSELRKKYMYEINNPTLRHLIQKDLNNFEKRTGICVELNVSALQEGILNFIVNSTFLDKGFTPRRGISTSYGLCDGKSILLKNKRSMLLIS